LLRVHAPFSVLQLHTDEQDDEDGAVLDLDD
jgi:hypothetical protein